ncbi:MAG: hypothetical protein EA397_18610 [Deltaproteobacteria bacterium]|nr:MAG: hypothetical protein EA397_18610 [Deltaproteobacteria bacterium]
MRILTLGGLILLATACARSRAPADDDIDGLSRFLFQNWEDARDVTDAMSNLSTWLEGPGRGEEAQNDGFVLDALTAEEVEDVEYPVGRIELEDLVGAVVTGESEWSIDHHAELLPMEDQTWNAPRNYAHYNREVIEGSVDAFLAPPAAEEQELIRTDNDVMQSRLGVRIPYTLRKDYRWVTTHDGARAIIGRTWAPNFGCSSSDGEGGNCLELSFSVDLFYEPRPGETIRMTASWNRLTLVVELGEDLQIATLANGMIKVFEDTDAFLWELYPDGP